MKKGKITPNGVSLEKHENDTVIFFTNLGYDIELIPPSHIPNTKSADFKMNGKKWGMKSPKGKSKSTLEHAFQAAAKQSDNVIFDLRRTSIPLEKSLTILSKLFDTSKRVKNLWVITKKQSLLKFPLDTK